MRILGLVLLAVSAGLAAPAAAADCGPLRQALAVDLKPAPGGGPRVGVPVTVNGTPRLMMLNTNYPESRVARSLVTQMNLSQRSYGKMLGLNGQVTNGYMVTIDLGIGSSVIKDEEMLVDENDAGFDGVFASDLMLRYDVELDFAAHKLNYFMTDHCEGKVVYWPTNGFTSIPFRGWSARPADTSAVNRTGMTPHPEGLTIPVSVDGHEVQAVIDTSFPQTTLDADTAHSLFDLTADSPGVVQLGTMDGTQAHRRFGYVFKTLSFGGVILHDPHIVMAPDLLGKKSSDMVQADSRIQRRSDDRLPTMRIGMDVLRNLHLYIASKEQKLYVTLAPQPGYGRGPGAPQPTP